MFMSVYITHSAGEDLHGLSALAEIPQGTIFALADIMLFFLTKNSLGSETTVRFGFPELMKQPKFTVENTLLLTYLFDILRV